MKCAVFSCLGLGDGLISLVLSNNLYLNGHVVHTAHPFLHNLQELVPHLHLSPSLSETYDRYFVFYEKSERGRAFLSHCLSRFPERTTVLNPIASSRNDYLYWEGGRFEGSRSFVDNLFYFCRDMLELQVTTRSNGLIPPPSMTPRKYLKRVLLHPSSSREGKNWPREKYLELAGKLRAIGCDPLFVLTQQEREGWDLREENCLDPHESGWLKMVCESGFMIGNDSGIGHLASCFGIPTLTIFRSAKTAQFWRPAWAPGKIVTPSAWIPNLKGVRLRDRYWKQAISVAHVLKVFQILLSSHGSEQSGGNLL